VVWHNFITMQNPKSLTRLYFPGEIAAHGRCILAPEQAHHVIRVLRLNPGDGVTLFDGRGGEYAAVITSLAKSGVTLNVAERVGVDRESPLAVTLAQAISSADRMDYTIQKAVELGVRCIQPLESSRSIVRLDAARATKRVAHWQAVAVAACEQCGRNLMPVVAPVLPLPNWLGHAAEHIGVARLMLSPRAQSNLRDLPRPPREVLLLAGPEGGLSPREQDDAQFAGFTPIRLGPRVLRTETAAVAALAAMQVLWGDF
jgi:16S rRNA (uracil1498-N3)-methyltransferase